MIVKFKKLVPEAKIPKKAHETDAGFDLTAVSRDWNDELGLWNYKTGISVEIPNGYAGFLFPRSSVFKTNLILSNCVGVIDSGYRGDIGAKFYEIGYGNPYKNGDRIGQLIIIPIPEIEFVEVQELSETERGNGGYGSTGR